MSDSIKNDKTCILPMIPLKRIVPFPKTFMIFDVETDRYIKTLQEAFETHTNIFLVCQKNHTEENVNKNSVYKTGVIAELKHLIHLPGGVVRVTTLIEERAIIKELKEIEKLFQVNVTTIEEIELSGEEDIEVEALMRTARDAFEDLVSLIQAPSTEIIAEALSTTNPGRLGDIIAFYLSVLAKEKQKLLEMLDPVERLMLATKMLHKELNIIHIQNDIFMKVKSSIDKNQKEHLLREQIKAMQEELGEKEIKELETYKEKLSKKNAPKHVTQKLEKEFKRMERIPPFSPENTVIRDYIEWVLDLPWSEKTIENKNIKQAEKILNNDHYGLEKVKERIIEFLAVKQYAPELYAPIICLVGPPGVGKTSIAKSVAKALNREYVRISLGGVKDEAEIRGHRKTYIGAMPGRIISAMKQAKTTNPIILLDEIDKLSSNYIGDPAFALLEVLDEKQNKNFRDHYIEIPYNLSDALFICTANSLDTVPAALKDRLEIISLSSYTEYEKFNIGKCYLLPKQFKKHCIKKSQLKIDDNAIIHIIKFYTKEAGVRQLERLFGDICRKVVKEFLLDKHEALVKINTNNLEKYLGKQKYKIDELHKVPQIGVARGLAWTGFGGDTLSIEVNTMQGSGKFKITGNIGDVMKESAQAAISYIRADYENLNVPEKFYKNKDIHIHIPEGATPKDGPSAGITMATAMVSALTHVPIKNDVGMTGEITLRGRVLPIGGLNEKILAAKNAGLTKIILPFENQRDLTEIPDKVKNGIEFVLAKTMYEVLENSLFVDMGR